MSQKETTVIALARFKIKNIAWAITQLALRRFFVQDIKGLQFFKVLGSGFEGGFGAMPGLNYQGLCFHFANEETALNFSRSGKILEEYQSKADEFFLSVLQAYSSRGSWTGNKVNPCTELAPQKKILVGPVASLTRASIKVYKARQFWAHTKGTETALDKTDGCLLAAGLGEAPLLRQATFTIWENSSKLDLYSKKGAHLSALKDAYEKNFFSESMFVRFQTKVLKGNWKGKCFD